MLIRITVQIHEFLTEFVPLRDRAKFNNIAGSAVLVKVHALRALSIDRLLQKEMHNKETEN